jgi:hypothetical protein
MEGPYPQTSWFALQHLSHTLAHLTGSAIREGYREDSVWRNATMFNQMRNSASEYAGFA